MATIYFPPEDAVVKVLRLLHEAAEAAAQAGVKLTAEARIERGHEHHVWSTGKAEGAERQDTCSVCEKRPRWGKWQQLDGRLFCSRRCHRAYVLMVTQGASSD